MMQGYSEMVRVEDVKYYLMCRGVEIRVAATEAAMKGERQIAAALNVYAAGVMAEAELICPDAIRHVVEAAAAREKEIR